MSNQFDCSIKVFKSDGGTESTNVQVREFFFEKHRVHHRLSCPYTLEQNGRA